MKKIFSDRIESDESKKQTCYKNIEASVFAVIHSSLDVFRRLLKNTPPYLEHSRRNLIMVLLSVNFPKLRKTHWLQFLIIPVVILYLYTDYRSIHDIISFVISIFAILFNMLAHRCIGVSQTHTCRGKEKNAMFFATLCFAISALTFLTLNLYTSYHSTYYQLAQLVPQSINAALAMTKVINYFSDVITHGVLFLKKKFFIRFLLHHRIFSWINEKEYDVYMSLSHYYIQFLQMVYRYVRACHLGDNIQSTHIRAGGWGIRSRCIQYLHPRIVHIYHKYAAQSKFERYFFPNDIRRVAGIGLSAFFLSMLDHNRNILNFLFSLCLCTFAGSQTIDRRDKPERADTYQLLHLYASRLLTVCSGLLFALDMKGLNAMKNAAFAILNALVQKIISETRKRTEP